MQYVQFNHLKVSRFILGSNPVSGFSHLGAETDQAMRHYFSSTRIKEMWRTAEALGINTLIARTDYHIIRLLMEYRDEGGALQWFAQICPECGTPEACIQRAADYGALACHLHGGVIDRQFALGKMDDVQPQLDLIRSKGMLASIASHNPGVIEWAANHLDLDYYLCSYYNPLPVDAKGDPIPEAAELYLEKDRQAMTAMIPGLVRPVVHYKILAAGRNDPAAAFDFVAARMRANDAVCVGIYPQAKPGMLEEDVSLLNASLIRAQLSVVQNGADAGAPRP